MTGIVAQNVGRTSGLIKSAGGGGGVWTLIKTLTASADATLSFVDGASDVVLDSTYPIYVFKFINIHPNADSAEFGFQADTGTNTNYNQTITSTWFNTFHRQDDVVSGLSYQADHDQAQGTGLQHLVFNMDNGNEDSLCGTLQIFNPSSSTFVKHFCGTFQYSGDGDSDEAYSVNSFVAGYVNTATALTRFQFKYASNDIDSGKIKLYGLSDS